jgi:hypothetical protein
MKNFIKLFGIIALVAVMVTVTGCAMLTTIGGTADPHGLFTGNGKAAALTEGATEIASYSVILGIVDAGYDEYAEAVKAAEASGKKVTSVTKNFYFILKTTADAK